MFIKPIVNTYNSTSKSFKSQIIANDYYKSAIKETKTDFSMAGYLNKGLRTVKALRGISEDGNHNLLEFFIKDNKVFTKVNGSIDKQYTFKSKGNKGADIQAAIINYAKETSSYSEAPLSKAEEKVIELQLLLGQAKVQLYKEMQNKLNFYK